MGHSSSSDDDNESSSPNNDDDDDDADDDDDSIDESYDDDSQSGGGTDTDSDSDGNSDSSPNSQSSSASEEGDTDTDTDSDSNELDSAIGDSGDVDTDSETDSDSDTDSDEMGSFGLITRVGGSGWSQIVSMQTTQGDSHSANSVPLMVAPQLWGQGGDDTPYEKYSFFTLLAILVLNVTAFGWCLCTRAMPSTKRNYEAGKLAEKIEIVESPAPGDTTDDETEEEEAFTD